MTPNWLPVVLVAGAFVAIALALVRLVKGPCQADRIIALDVVFASTISLTIAAALVSGRVLFLDIAVGLSMVGFVATIVWARFIDAGTRSHAAKVDSEKDPQ